LGGKASFSDLISYDEAIEIFNTSLEDLVEYAKNKKVILLIENNVCDSNAINKFHQSPYLLDSTSSILNFFSSQKSKDFGLLMDLAHLKVSSNSLDFNLEESLNLLKNFIQGYHFSDNDGLSDTNLQFDVNAWFWPFIKKDLDYYTIEVYTPDLICLHDQVALLKDKINA
jgi:sugar phosphate isomerase/epimerase